MIIGDLLLAFVFAFALTWPGRVEKEACQISPNLLEKSPPVVVIFQNCQLLDK